MAKDNRHFALREKTYARTMERLEEGKRVVVKSPYQNWRHADRRARAEFGAYSRSAAKRMLYQTLQMEAGLGLSGGYIAHEPARKDEEPNPWNVILPL
ncbi:MAG: hypothetical protein QXD77_01110 [Candidatus Aenigmatarchaeota archaeon]